LFLGAYLQPGCKYSGDLLCVAIEDFVAKPDGEADAYAKALSFDPSNVVVEADLGASRCFYGNGTNNQDEATAGLQQIRKALAQIPDSEQPRVLLNLGFCLAESTPRQTEEAIATWQKITTLVASDSPFAIQATQLIAQIKK
jgi:cytochrome c-type biogenesis protein CcmH/NrfG